MGDGFWSIFTASTITSAGGILIALVLIVLHERRHNQVIDKNTESHLKLAISMEHHSSAINKLTQVIEGKV